MLAVGKHLILARKKSASAIDHVDAREAVLAGDLLRSGWGVYARGGGGGKAGGQRQKQLSQRQPGEKLKTRTEDAS